MGNYFHLVLRIHPEGKYSDNEIRERFKAYYDEERELSSMQIPFYREKLASLSDFVKDLKQGFSRFYNKRHNRKGCFWADRFKSLIVENGETLINLLAYVSLNAVRAGIVSAPEDYRWCSLGHHVQTDNKYGLLSSGFGSTGQEMMSDKEKFRRYRMFIYNIGAKKISGKRAIDEKKAQQAAANSYEIPMAELFKQRIRYFFPETIVWLINIIKFSYLIYIYLLPITRNG